jgi:hypothetical protein
LFIEKGLHHLNIGGNLNYIVPISVTSSDSLSGVHRLIENSCNEIKVSSYAVRPQPIFENAVVNTSIFFLIKSGSKCERILSTKMYRKSKEFDLKRLLDNLEFIDVFDYRRYGRYPKISLPIEQHILKKIFSQKTGIGSLIRNKGKPIYYRSTGGRYFKVITNYSTGSTKEKALFFDPNIADSIGAILSSNLFFWFYQIYSNNLDLKSYEIALFKLPLEYISGERKEILSKLYISYLKDIEKNANVRQTTQYANIDSFKEYKIGKSKQYIDKIDD